MADTQPAMTYPTEEQYSRWKDRAEAMDMSVSEWMQAMIEAGSKKFTAAVEPDETNRELRQQRNDLKTELDHARDRIDRLEDQLHRSERATVKQFIEENPGAAYPEIAQHVIDTVPERVNLHLESLQGEEIRSMDGEYHPVEGGD